MAYSMLSDDYLAGLEAAGVTRDARLLALEALVYCNTALTDGAIRVRLSRISDADDLEALAAELVAAGEWIEDDSGYRVARYTRREGGHQRSREQVLRDQEANRIRQANYRDKVQASKTRNAVTHDVTNAALPIPSLPDPKGGKGKGTEAASAAARLTARSDARARTMHVYAGNLDRCQLCDKAISNRVHIRTVPAITRAATVLASHAITLQAEIVDDAWRGQAEGDRWRLEVWTDHTKPAATLASPWLEITTSLDTDNPVTFRRLRDTLTEQLQQLTACTLPVDDPDRLVIEGDTVTIFPAATASLHDVSDDLAVLLGAVSVVRTLEKDTPA